MRTNPRFFNSTWYKLYPRKRDNSGWWDYGAYNPETYKSSLDLHKGHALNRGYACIAVLGDECWERLTTVINSSVDRDRITATYHDVIKKPDYEVQADIIGYLTIHD